MIKTSRGKNCFQLIIFLVNSVRIDSAVHSILHFHSCTTILNFAQKLVEIRDGKSRFLVRLHWSIQKSSCTLNMPMFLKSPGSCGLDGKMVSCSFMPIIAIEFDFVFRLLWQQCFFSFLFFLVFKRCCAQSFTSQNGQGRQGNMEVKLLHEDHCRLIWYLKK